MNPPKQTPDPRFANLATDPRYRLPSRKNTHVKIDKRFSRMLRDEDFSKTARRDRYGRRIPETSGRKKLERMYVVDDEDNNAAETVSKNPQLESINDRSYDPARDGGFLSQSSSSESESDSDDEDSSSTSSSEAEMDQDIQTIDDQTLGAEEEYAAEDIPTGEISSRLAVVNLDWDNIRAVDLLAVAQSFCPLDGRVLEVAIYPSEFGKERMEREETEGPPAEMFAASRKSKPPPEPSPPPDSSGDDDDAKIKKSILAHASASETEVDGKALRAYQLSRLRYYYAVLSCSSEATAKTLYDAMDGREYLSTSNFFDLRFVPDGVAFDDKPRDLCEKVPDGYKPQEFVTEALTHSKVRLTWDEEDKERKEAQKRAFSASQSNDKRKSRDGAARIDDDDLKAYIGSDSDSGESNEADMEATLGLNPATTTNLHNGPPAREPELSKSEQARRKLREALGLSVEEAPRSRPQNKEARAAPEGNMQITFSAALGPTSSDPKDNPNNGSQTIFQNKPEDVREETTVEKYVRKEKERKARRKEKAKSKYEGSGDQMSPLPATAVESPGKTNATKDEEHDSEADPFDDPFFTNPQASNATSRKAARKAKAAQEAAEAERGAAERKKERAELELLMDDDAAPGTDGARPRNQGFDMAAIRKAEKEAARKGKKKRRRNEQQDAGDVAMADDFEMDVKDPRFASVFENHEFAIDPSNPRFSRTKGMNSLLEEGRARRKRKIEDEDHDPDTVIMNNFAGNVAATGNGVGNKEVDELVSKIKRRSKAQ